MNGVFQTIFQRGISAGLYFPLEEIFTSYLKGTFHRNSTSGSGSGTSETWLLLCAGLMAGAGNGIIMNPISSIKYHYWGLSGGGVGHTGGEVAGLHPDGKKNSFTTVALDMFKRGGMRPFFVGVNATISRDVVFGGAFSYFRHELPRLSFFTCPATSSCFSLAWILRSFSASSLPSASAQSSSEEDEPSTSATMARERREARSNIHNSNSSSNNDFNSANSSHNPPSAHKEPKNTFLTDLISGLIATTLSSPLNYVRNIHYSLPPDIKPDSTMKVLSELWVKAMEEKTIISKLSHIQSRLRLGWGTARVGCGMALASQFYSFIKSQI